MRGVPFAGAHAGVACRGGTVAGDRANALGWPLVAVAGSQVAVGDFNVVGHGNTVTHLHGGSGSVAEPSTVEDAAELLLAPPPPAAGQGPAAGPLLSRWLRPDSGVLTPWRRPETDHLLAWCRSPGGPVLRVVCGPGGQGKTQLAGQVCAELRASGWLAGLVDLPARPGGGPEPFAGQRRGAELAAGVQALGRLDVPALLVVDYAESHPGVVDTLLRSAVRVALAGRAAVRVLLLSRSGLDWLEEHPCHEWVSPVPLLLPSLSQSLVSAAGQPEPGGLAAVTGRVWARAYAEFGLAAAREARAGRLDRASPEPGHGPARGLGPGLGHEPGREPGPVGLADQARAGTTTLDLYADALLRVLDRYRPVGAPAAAGEGVASGPVSRLAAHDRGMLARALAAAGVPLSRYEQEMAMSAVFLRPAADTDTAVEMLAALPRLRSRPVAEIERVVEVLTGIFPAEDGTAVWQAPRPDRLVDVHLLGTARRARSDPDWLAHALAVGGSDDPAVAAQVSGTLLRALTAPEAGEGYQDGAARLEHALAELLRAHPAGYAPALVDRAPSRFGEALLAVLDPPPAAGDAAAAPGAAEPVGSRTGAGPPAPVAVPAAAPVSVVRDIDAALSAAGTTTSRLAIAVAVSRRLVAATRPAGTTSPEQTGEHVRHLVALSRRLAEAGQPGAAMEPAERAVEHARRLCQPATAAGRLVQGEPPPGEGSGAGLADPAAGAAAAAGDTAGSPGAPAGPGGAAERALLAAALHNLGSRLAGLGHVVPAVDAAGEAVTLRRELAASGGAAERADLAAALHNLGLWLTEADEPEQAAAAAGEAVALFREQAGAAGDPALAVRLALALTNLAQLRSAAGDVAGAVPPAGEAVALLRRLATASPDSYRAALAAALVAVSHQLAPPDGRARSTRSSRRAVRLAAEAVQLCRHLAQANPQAYRGDLAQALANLGLRRAVAGQHAGAVAATEEAVRLHGHVEAGPVPHPPGPPGGSGQGDAGTAAERVGGTVLADAVERAGEPRDPDLGAARGDSHQAPGPVHVAGTGGPELAGALTNLALQRASAGGQADALGPARRAGELYRQVAAAHPEARAELAAALTNLGYLLAGLSRHADAATAAGQAVELYGDLLAEHPRTAYRVRRADAQHNLGLHHLYAGNPDQAVGALTAATDGYRELVGTALVAVRGRYRAAAAALEQANRAVAAGAGWTPRQRTRPAPRYARHWHEAAIRYPLPGIAVLAAWRTDLAACGPAERWLREELVEAAIDRRGGSGTAEAGRDAVPEAAATVPASQLATAGLLPGLAGRVERLAGALSRLGRSRPRTTAGGTLQGGSRLGPLSRLSTSRLVTTAFTYANTPVGRFVSAVTAVTAAAAVAVTVAVVAPRHQASAGPVASPSTEPPEVSGTADPTIGSSGGSSSEAGSSSPGGPGTGGPTSGGPALTTAPGGPMTGDPSQSGVQSTSAAAGETGGSGTATTSPPPLPPPAWGYAGPHYAQRQTDLGVEVVLTKEWQVGTWMRSSDPAMAARLATMIRTGTGRYLVRLPGLGVPGVVHVQFAFGGDSAYSCQAVGTRVDGVDRIVDVACFNAAGILTNLYFIVTFASVSRGEPPIAVANYRNGAEPGASEVTRTGTGRYTVRAPGAFTGNGVAIVTPYGQTPVHCRPTGITGTRTGLQVTVACDSFGGSPADTGWALSYTEGVGAHHDPAARAAYLTTQGDPASPVIDGDRTWSTIGDTPTVTRTAPGHYTVWYQQLGNPATYPGDAVLVTAVGTTPRYCMAHWWNSYSFPPKVLITIDCFDLVGHLADATFAVDYLRIP
jgi:tetratricopeptide (TPR) repeat protein